MRKFLLGLFLLLSQVALGQFTYQFTGNTAATGSTIGYNISATGATIHKIVWTVQGTLNSCSVTVDTSADNSSWSAGGAIGSQTCTSNGNAQSTTVIANYVRVSYTIGTGGGTLTFNTTGYINTPAGGGTVTSVTCGTGMSGGTFTTSGTCNLANTAVTPASYTNANITVDQQGRITAASNGSGGSSTYPTFKCLNDATGTSLNKLAVTTDGGIHCHDAPATPSVQSKVVGVTTAGNGTSGSATIQISGPVSTIFDGATTAGDWVILSSTSGDAHDAGTTLPTVGALQCLGNVETTNGAGGTFVLDLRPCGVVDGAGTASNALMLYPRGASIPVPTLITFPDATPNGGNPLVSQSGRLEFTETGGSGGNSSDGYLQATSTGFHMAVINRKMIFDCDTASNGFFCTFNGFTSGKRWDSNQATTLTTGAFTLSAGWGSTAATAITLATSKDQASVTTITTGGTGIAANPTYQITFTDGTWTQVPVCTAIQTGGNDIIGDFTVTARSATAYTFQFNGTPTTGKTYEVSIQCLGT